MEKYRFNDLINNPLKSDIIDKCKLNKELSDYMKLDYINITKWNLIDIIISSPEISIEEKIDIFKSLLEYDKYEENMDEINYENSFKYYYDNLLYIFNELKNIKEDELLIVNTMIYDPYDSDSQSINTWDYFPAKSYTEAIQYINENFQYIEEYGWFEIDKWVHNNKFERVYNYIFIGNKLVYVSSEDNKFQGYKNDIMNPIPFHPGDIVDIDITPFEEKQQVLLIEVDNSDYYGIQCLYKDKSGLYNVCNLRERFCCNPYSYIPPTARLQKTNPEEINEIFNIISKFIINCHYNGIDIKSTFFHDNLSEESLLNLIKTINLPEED